MLVISLSLGTQNTQSGSGDECVFGLKHLFSSTQTQLELSWVLLKKYPVVSHSQKFPSSPPAHSPLHPITTSSLSTPQLQNPVPSPVNHPFTNNWSCPTSNFSVQAPGGSLLHTGNTWYIRLLLMAIYFLLRSELQSRLLLLTINQKNQQKKTQ